jgi:hypothetical protein
MSAPRPLVPLLLLGAALTSPPAEAGCPDPGPLSRELDAAVLAQDWLRAQRGIDALTEALGCGDPADPAQLGALFRAHGAALLAGGAADEARLAFAAAVQVDPAGRTLGLSAPAEAAFTDAGRSVGQLGAGTITLDPAPQPAFSVLLDGRPVRLPATAPAGAHLVQVMAPYDAPRAGSKARSARLVLLFDGEQLVVDPGPVSIEPAPGTWDPPPTAAPAGRPRPELTRPMLISAGSLALGAGAFWAGAAVQPGRAEDAARLQDSKAALAGIDRAEALHRGLGITSYALLGLSASALTVGLIF